MEVTDENKMIDQPNLSCDDTLKKKKSCQNSVEKETILREKKTDKDNLLSPGRSKKNRSIPSSPTVNLLREMSDKLIKREKTVTFGEYVSFDEDLDVNAKNVRFE